MVLLLQKVGSFIALAYLVFFRLVVLRKFQQQDGVELQHTLPNLAAHKQKKKKLLKVLVVGGLSNQNIQIMDAIVIAQETNRNLVIPSVVAHLSNSEIYAGSNVPRHPFAALWDPNHFVACVERLTGVNVVIEEEPETNSQCADKVHCTHRKRSRNSEHNLTIHTSTTTAYYHYKDWIRDEHKRNSTSLLESFPTTQLALQHLQREPADIIQVAAPFLFLLQQPGLFQVEPRHQQQQLLYQCFQPSRNVRHLVQQMAPRHGSNDYTCLHARIEKDWFEHCCGESHLQLDPHTPSSWRCANGNQPPASCFVSATAIRSRMSQHAQLGWPKIHNPQQQSSSLLWIASGASRRALEPLLSARNASTTTLLAPSHDSNQHFMDYRYALAHQVICSKAQTVWTHSGSSFAWALYPRRNIFYYDLPVWQMWCLKIYFDVVVVVSSSINVLGYSMGRIGKLLGGLFYR